MWLPVSFIGLVLLSVILFYKASGGNKSVVWFFLLWLPLVALLSWYGFFRNTQALPPRMFWIVLPSILYSIFFYRKLKALSLKPQYLLAIHALRLPVELILHKLYLAGKVPVIMTYDGRNFDILSGLSALLLLLYMLCYKRKLPAMLMRIWNLSGLLLLGIIVMTAILSAPSPFQQFGFDQPNRALTEFPYSLLPAVLVPVVALSHLLYLKKLREEQADGLNP